MTDKQIMIDGVNVNECIHLYSRWPGSIPPDSCACWEEPNNLTDTPVTDCKRHENCYFKQLARKTQECERSRKRISDLEERIINHSNEIEEYCSRLADKNKKCEKYEQVMKNIEEICLKDVHTFADGTQLRYDSLDEILDIINKAKDGN